MPPPSAKRTTPTVVGLATFPVEGRPDPSANATDVNDRNNSAIANIRFMLILLKFWYGKAPKRPRRTV